MHNKIPSKEDVKRWHQLLVGIGEKEMNEDILRFFNSDQGDDKYKEEFLFWREKYFEKDIISYKWKSKANSGRFTDIGLHEKFWNSRLESPFK